MSGGAAALRGRRSSGVRVATTLTLIVLAWLWIWPRMIPTLAASHDFGALLSVAERLRAGDRLYADVWGNKDPFHYYVLALAQCITRFGGILAEVVWLAITMGSIVWATARLGAAAHASVLCGLVATPLAAMGTCYLPGMTHLPGVALTTTVVSASLASRWRTVGVTVGLLWFTKLTMVPIAAVAIVVLVQQGGRRAALTRIMKAWAVVMIQSVVLLATRGELLPYLRAQRANLAYSDNGVQGMEDGEQVAHLWRVFPASGASSAMATLTAILVVLFLTRRRGEPSTEHMHRLWWACLAMTVTAVLVLASTGMWPHHGQSLYPAALFTLVWFVARSSEDDLILPTMLLLALVLAGSPTPRLYHSPRVLSEQSMRQMTPTSPEAQALLAQAPTGTYARLGAHDPDGHARGLGSWRLGCARTSQYYFDPPELFSSDLACMSHVDAVIVNRDFHRMSDQAAWNGFVADAESTLKSGFTCHPTAFGRLCWKNGQ